MKRTQIKLIIIIVLFFLIGLYCYSGGSKGPGFLFNGEYYYNVRGKGLCRYSPQTGFAVVSNVFSSGLLLGQYNGIAYCFFDDGVNSKICALNLEKAKMYTVVDITILQNAININVCGFQIPNPRIYDGCIQITIRLKDDSCENLTVNNYLYDIDANTFLHESIEMDLSPYDLELLQVAAQGTEVSGYVFDGRYIYGWSWQYNHVSNVYEISYSEGKPCGSFIHHIPFSQRGFDLPF